MPNWIGHTPSDIGAVVGPLDDDAWVQVKWSQARVLRATGVEIRARLDTSDRGGPGRLAKRWYRWYAPAAALLAPGRSAAMRSRAECHQQLLALRDYHLYEAHKEALREESLREEYVLRYPWAVELSRTYRAHPCVRIYPSPVCHARLRPTIAEALHDVGGACTHQEGANGFVAPRTVEEMERYLDPHRRIYHGGVGPEDPRLTAKPGLMPPDPRTPPSRPQREAADEQE